MNRRLPTFVVVLTALVLASSATRAESRPNVLFIAIDDLNDWVGCLGGHSQASTPNIDRLAKRGVLFTNAHCQAPICNPSRTSLMLGLRPSTTGIYENRPWFRSVPKTRNSMTLTEYFRSHGYETLATGKIFHGSRPDPKSFETHGDRPGQKPRHAKRLVKSSPSKTPLWDWGAQTYDLPEYSDHRVATWAVDRIAKLSKARGASKDTEVRPFFLAVGFYRPHVPLYAPKAYLERLPLEKVRRPKTLENDRADLPAAAVELTHNPLPPAHAWFVENKEWRPAVRAYLASTTFMDAQIGRVLDALDASPFADETIIVLFSDHGFFLGEKERWAKQSLWERATRVPMIISLPKKRNGGKSTKPVELLSLYPTLVELCGLPKKKGLEGVSLAPLVRDPSAPWKHAAVTTYKRGNHSVRSEHFRYIRYADGSEELYDHRSDPHEWKNVASDPNLSETIARLRRSIPAIDAPVASRR